MNLSDMKMVEFLDVITRNHFIEDKGMELIHPTLEQSLIRFIKSISEKVAKEYQGELKEVETFSDIYDNISSRFFLKNLENSLNRTR